MHQFTGERELECRCRKPRELTDMNAYWHFLEAKIQWRDVSCLHYKGLCKMPWTLLDLPSETAYVLTIVREERVLSWQLSRQVFMKKSSHSSMVADHLFQFGIFSPLLPSAGASETHFHSSVPVPDNHSYDTCLVFKVITAQIRPHS